MKNSKERNIYARTEYNYKEEKCKMSKKCTFWDGVKKGENFIKFFRKST